MVLVLAGCSSVPSEPDAQPDKSEQAQQGEQGKDGEKAKKDEKPKGPRPIPDAVKSQFAAGLEALRNKEYSKADLLFEEITLAHPQYAGPWVNRGIIAVEREQFKDADTHFDQAIKANPSNPDAYIQWAFALRNQGRFGEAADVYAKGLAAAPTAAMYLNAGVLQDLYMHNKQDALALFEQYQSMQSEPDKTVAGWIADLKRQVADQ